MALQMSVEVVGLQDAIASIAAAFPKDPQQQRKILNQTMSGAAKTAIIPRAKQLALHGDASGALSESIAPRAVSLSRALARGRAAIIEITPVRSDHKAMAKYIAFYYTARGRTAPAFIATSGIRHGHLIEFGHLDRAGQSVAAAPFLWPAAIEGNDAYTQAFAKSVGKKIEAAVRRRAKVRASK